MFDTLLADNAQAWELRADSTWKRLRPKKDDRPLGAQAALMRAQLRGPSSDCSAPWVAVAVPTYVPLRMGS